MDDNVHILSRSNWTPVQCLEDLLKKGDEIGKVCIVAQMKDGGFLTLSAGQDPRDMALASMLLQSRVLRHFSYGEREEKA